MKGIIYKYTFKDGKVYIGQTRRPQELRFAEHFNESTGPKNPTMWEAYKKFGMPRYEVIYEEECDDEDELVNSLNQKETLFIAIYKADDPRYGYNIRSWGIEKTKTNRIVCEKYHEHMDKVLESKLELYNKAVDKIYNTKEPLTEEENYLLKYKYPENMMCDLSKYDLNNYDNYKEEEQFEIEEGLEYVEFLIKEEAEEEVDLYIRSNFNDIKRGKNILQIDMNGKVVREFVSVNDICYALGLKRGDNVRNVLNGKQKTAYGYYWKYKKDIKTI